jgi:hypothetical protein
MNLETAKAIVEELGFTLGSGNFPNEIPVLKNGCNVGRIYIEKGTESNDYRVFVERDKLPSLKA